VDRNLLPHDDMSKALETAGTPTERQVPGDRRDLHEPRMGSEKRCKRFRDVGFSFDQPRQDGRIPWGGQGRCKRPTHMRLATVGTLRFAHPTRITWWDHAASVARVSP
jgi:hypothetical protein